MKIRYWLSSKRRQMAKLHDLARQLQEAWDDIDGLILAQADSLEAHDYLREQLGRVARERDIALEQLRNEEE